jgi:DNA-directed RNA polymerase alpha subunit
MINVDVSFMNALRRILLSEIPTVALENIYMWHNNSIIHDEVLSHRLGLIPLNIDARLLDDPYYYNNNVEPENKTGTSSNQNEMAPTDRNTVVFRLSVSCSKNDAKEAKEEEKQNTNKYEKKGKQKTKDEHNNAPDEMETDVEYDDSMIKEEEASIVRNPDETNATASSGNEHQQEMDDAIKAATSTATSGNSMNSGNSTNITSNKSTNSNKTSSSYKYPKNRPYTKHVYSKDLKWVPQGEQLSIFGENAMEMIRPIHDDILIAKLRPGQSIDLEAHGQRGIGKDHAKYSPVCTAYYRLMPYIEIVEPIYDDHAKELVYVYEPGVFDLIPTDPTIDPIHTKMKATLTNPYACTMSRNYMKNPILKQSLRIKRISNHYIFNIESIGQHKPSVLLAEALRTLQRKCNTLLDHIEEYQVMKENM